MTDKNKNLESREKAVLSDALVLPLRVIDLDSPFFFGVGRDMTEDERANAERHGRFDNPPMSVLGVTSDGLAAVDGKELAQLFVAAPDLLAACQHIIEQHGGQMPHKDCICVDCDYLRPIQAAVAKAIGQNEQGHSRAKTE